MAEETLNLNLKFGSAAVAVVVARVEEKLQKEKDIASDCW